MSLIPKIRADYYDPISGKSYIADTDGLHEEHIHIRNQVVDPETLEWTNQIQGTAVGGEEEVAVTNWPTTQAVSGPLTDTELRNSDVKVTLDGESLSIDESCKATAIYEDGDSTYVCSAPVGSSLSDPVWQIKVLDEGSVPTQMLWCDGDANYDNTATDIATVRGHSYL